MATFVMSAIGATSASAATWQGCTSTAPVLEFTTSACSTKGPPNSFGWEALPAAKAITSKSVGNLTLSDSVAGTTIECKGTDKGSVGPGSKDEVTTITATGCTFVKAGSCESGKPVTATAKNLPWVTEVKEEPAGSGKIRDFIKPHAGGGMPGYDVECTVAGIFKVQDECLGETNTGMKNAAGGVEAEFDATTPKVKCSIGGAGSGTVKGIDLNENPASGAIRVSL